MLGQVKRAIIRYLIENADANEKFLYIINGKVEEIVMIPTMIPRTRVLSGNVRTYNVNQILVFSNKRVYIFPGNPLTSFRALFRKIIYPMNKIELDGVTEIKVPPEAQDNAVIKDLMEIGNVIGKGSEYMFLILVKNNGEKVSLGIGSPRGLNHKNIAYGLLAIVVDIAINSMLSKNKGVRGLVKMATSTALNLERLKEFNQRVQHIIRICLGQETGPEYKLKPIPGQRVQVTEEKI